MLKLKKRPLLVMLPVMMAVVYFIALRCHLQVDHHMAGRTVVRFLCVLLLCMAVTP
jgi:hypothetical protein